MEGSSDSVVFERFCVVFEKKGVGVDGKEIRGGRMLSLVWELEFVFVSCRKIFDKVCIGGGEGLSVETFVRVFVCFYLFLLFIRVFNKRTE